MGNGIARQAEVIRGDGMIGRLIVEQRRMLLEAFGEFSQAGGTVLDIGLGTTSAHPATSCLNEIPGRPVPPQVTLHRARFVNILDTPRTKRKKVSGSFKLPFADGEFDWTCSSCVIEHMGNADRQFNLVREMARVARKGVFVATPNRFHPVNFSSVMRSQMLRAQDLYRYATLLPGKPEHDVGHKRVFGIKAHFFLMIQKRKPPA